MVFLFYMEADLVYKRQYYKLIKNHDKFTDGVVLLCSHRILKKTPIGAKLTLLGEG